MVFRTSTPDGADPYIQYIQVAEDALPDGVYVDGVAVRDTRDGEAVDG